MLKQTLALRSNELLCLMLIGITLYTTGVSLAKNETTKEMMVGRSPPHLIKPHMEVSPATTATSVLKVLSEKLIGVGLGTPATLVFKDSFSSVIFGSKLLITQHFIGLANILEFLFGFFLIISVLIRMPCGTLQRVVESSVASQVGQKCDQNIRKKGGKGSKTSLAH
jgi:hypothetical protein